MASAANEFGLFRQEVLAKVSFLGVQPDDVSMIHLWKCVSITCSGEGTPEERDHQAALQEHMLITTLSKHVGTPRAEVFLQWLGHKLQALLTPPPPADDGAATQKEEAHKVDHAIASPEEPSPHIAPLVKEPHKEFHSIASPMVEMQPPEMMAAASEPKAVRKSTDGGEEWVKLCSDTGRIYFWGRRRQACVWSLPEGVSAKWTGVNTENGRTYYFGADRTPVWELPKLKPEVMPGSEESGEKKDASEAQSSGKILVPARLPALKKAKAKATAAEKSPKDKADIDAESSDEDVEVPGATVFSKSTTASPSPDRRSAGSRGRSCSSSGSTGSSSSAERSTGSHRAEAAGESRSRGRARSVASSRKRSPSVASHSSSEQSSKAASPAPSRSRSAERWMPSPSAGSRAQSRSVERRTPSPSSERCPSVASSSPGRKSRSEERVSGPCKEQPKPTASVESPGAEQSSTSANAGEAQEVEVDGESKSLQRSESLKFKLELEMLRHELGGLHKMLAMTRAQGVQDASAALAANEVVAVTPAAAREQDLCLGSPRAGGSAPEEERYVFGSPFQVQTRATSPSPLQAAGTPAVASWSVFVPPSTPALPSSSPMPPSTPGRPSGSPFAARTPARWQRRLRQRSRSPHRASVERSGLSASPVAAKAFDKANDILSGFMGDAFPDTVYGKKDSSSKKKEITSEEQVVDKVEKRVVSEDIKIACDEKGAAPLKEEGKMSKEKEIAVEEKDIASDSNQSDSEASKVCPSKEVAEMPRKRARNAAFGGA